MDPLRRFCISYTRSSRSILRRFYCENSGVGSLHRPSDFDRKILVYSKMYKKLDTIPKEIPVATMKKAKDWFRIRVNIGMGLACLGACVVMVISGKAAHESGDSLAKQNKEWHERENKKVTK